MLPDAYPIVFLRRTVRELAESFQQSAEVRLMKGMLQPKDTVAGGSMFPESLLKRSRITDLLFIDPGIQPFVRNPGSLRSFESLT
jgi:hypothetical protein